MWGSDFLTIDGIVYKIPVETNIKRQADILDKYAKRVDSGDLKRKIIGVYKNYSLSFSEKQTDLNYDEYNRLYDKLTEPVEFHTVKIGNYTFIAYITAVADNMYLYRDGKEYYKGLKAEFIAKSPWRK